MSVGVTVVELKEGRLFYELSSGREVERPIEQVTFLQISGWDAFNAAEKLMQEGRHRAAAEAYEQLLHDKDAAASVGRLDRGLLVRSRLIRACDQDGRFDRAVEVYLEVAERMPAAVESLRPARLPNAGSTFLPAAATAVDAAIARRRGTPLGVSLARWRMTWPDAAATTTRTADPDASPESRRLREELAAVESLIAAGSFDDALARLQPLQNDKAGAQRPEVFYWQGRAWWGKSEKEGKEDRERDVCRAGLAFMRVAIHYPGHPLAPESLFRAGEVCSRSGQPGRAGGLWAELARRYPGVQPWSAKAQLLSAGEAASKPAAGQGAR
ncbi:MAG TPA: hypothetical protein VLM89_14135 [Phycisphaerae bacterium]|nr:hypothetical protein [Phycisphaerae bacterium]